MATNRELVEGATRDGTDTRNEGVRGSNPASASLGLGSTSAAHDLFGSSSSSPENSGVMRRECGYTRYVL